MNYIARNKRRIKIILLCCLCYLVLWRLTFVYGAPKVHAHVQEAMILPPLAKGQYQDVSDRVGLGLVWMGWGLMSGNTTGVYYCRSHALAPFVTYVISGWDIDDGDAQATYAFYIWLPGGTFKIGEKRMKYR